MSDKKRLNKVVAIRLNDEEYKSIKNKFKDTDLKDSALFRELLLSKSAQIEVKKEDSKDYSRAVFLINKTSNNINQLAKAINTAYRSEAVSESLFLTYLKELQAIQNHLLNTIGIKR